MAKMKVNISELTGAALDWAVAKCEGDITYLEFCRLWRAKAGTSANWSQGGPIIEREHIAISWVVSNYLYVTGCWSAHIPQTNGKLLYAHTPLIAAMRCYVASKLGDEVEVPDELIKEKPT